MNHASAKRAAGSAAPRLPATDARTARTRAALKSALLELVSIRSFEDVTIRDIVAGAGVNYATFFRHYPTREALLEDMAAEQIQQLVRISVAAFDAADVHAGCVVTCDHVQEHRAIWSVLLNGGAQQIVREQLIRFASEVAVKNARGAIPADLGVSVAVSSMVEILSWWLRQPAPYPIEKVVEMLERIAISPVVHYGQ